MARDDKEHRMLFDLRGRRRNVVKVVYATLAVLMGLSLFLVIGGFNIAELFNSDSGNGNGAEIYEDQAERIEAKLRKDPQDEALLASLTRAQINAGNASVEVEANGARIFTLEALQQYQQASETWSRYLEAGDEANSSVAQLMASTLFTLAEYSRNYPETFANLEAAVKAQRIVAEQRPDIGPYTTLAIYTYFTGDFEAADEARKEAKKLAGTKAEREAIDTQLDEVEERAKGFQKEVKEAKRQNEAAAKGNGGAAPEGIEGPSLGEALGGGSLSE